MAPPRASANPASWHPHSPHQTFHPPLRAALHLAHTAYPRAPPPSPNQSDRSNKQNESSAPASASSPPPPDSTNPPAHYTPALPRAGKWYSDTKLRSLR